MWFIRLTEWQRYKTKGKEKKDIRKKGEVNFNNMTMTPFRIIIVS